MRHLIVTTLFAATSMAAAACASKPLPAPTMPTAAVVDGQIADGGELPIEAPQASPEPVELDVATALDNRFIPAAKPGSRVVRLRLSGRKSSTQSRPRANITLVVDTSSSMQGDAIEQARQASLALVDDLRDGDVLSVVTFGSEAKIVAQPTALNEKSRDTIRAGINAIEALGTTDLAGGLTVGVQLARQMVGNGEINRMVLMSDGVPNDEAPVLGLAQQARNSGIAVTTLGLGLEFHETLLGQIAQTSGGRFHFVEQPDQVAAVFHDEVLSMDRIAAQGLTLMLTPGPGVAISQVFGYSHGINGRQFVVSLPDLAEGQQHDVLVELAIGEHRDGATVELLDGVVSFVDGHTNQSVQQRTFVSVEATADASVIDSANNVEVALAGARARVALTTLQVVAMARGGDVKAAKRRLDEAVKAAKAVKAKHADPELARLIDDLVELRPTLAALAPPPVDPYLGRGPKRPTARRGRGAAPQPKPASSTGLSVEQARSVREGHDRAYQMINGG